MSHILNVIVVGQQEPEKIPQVGKLVIKAENHGVLLENYLKDISGVRYLIMEEDETGYQCSCPFAYYSSDKEQRLILRIPEELYDTIRNSFNDLIQLSPVKSLIIYLETNRIVTFPDEEFPVEVKVNHILGLQEFWEKHNIGEIQESIIYIIN